MEQIKTIVRKWGNSFGVVLPKKTIDHEKIRDGLEVVITIHPSEKTKVKDVFNLSKKLNLPKLKKSTQELLDEVDEELWGNE